MTGYTRAADQFTTMRSDRVEAMVDASWLSGDVARLVWSRLPNAEVPYLADALEEAGCTADAMLLHLRHAHVGEDSPYGICSVVEAVRRKLAALGRTPPSLGGDSE
jgi:hypothetical protein